MAQAELSRDFLYFAAKDLSFRGENKRTVVKTVCGWDNGLILFGRDGKRPVVEGVRFVRVPFARPRFYDRYVHGARTYLLSVLV